MTPVPGTDLVMAGAPNRFRKLFGKRCQGCGAYGCDGSAASYQMAQISCVEMQEKEFPNAPGMAVGMHPYIDNEYYLMWQRS